MTIDMLLAWLEDGRPTNPGLVEGALLTMHGRIADAIRRLQADVDRNERAARGWRAAALNRIGKCGTCEGDGIMEIEREEGREPDVEPCGECGGTGRGDVAHAIGSLREQIERLEAQLDAACNRYAGIEVRYDEQCQYVERLKFDKREVVDALAEIVTKTSDKTEIGQLARRTLGLHR